MSLLGRVTDFIPGTAILSSEVDAEFNQLVNILAGVSTNKNALIKVSDAVEAPLALDQLSSGPAQTWRAAGIEKARMKVNGQMVGVSKCIHTNFSAVGTVLTGLDDLQTFSLPAASLNAQGDYVDVTYSGTFATNDSNKRIVISFGGQVVDDGGLFDQDAGSWMYTIRYLRVANTQVRFALAYQWGIFSADGASAVTGNGRSNAANGLITVADMSANALTLKAQGESNASAGTGTNDIIHQMSIIQLTQNT